VSVTFVPLTFIINVDHINDLEPESPAMGDHTLPGKGQLPRVTRPLGANARAKVVGAEDEALGPEGAPVLLGRVVERRAHDLAQVEQTGGRLHVEEAAEWRVRRFGGDAPQLLVDVGVAPLDVVATLRLRDEECSRRMRRLELRLDCPN